MRCYFSSINDFKSTENNDNVILKSSSTSNRLLRLYFRKKIFWEGSFTLVICDKWYEAFYCFYLPKVVTENVKIYQWHFVLTVFNHYITKRFYLDSIYELKNSISDSKLILRGFLMYSFWELTGEKYWETQHGAAFTKFVFMAQTF